MIRLTAVSLAAGLAFLGMAAWFVGRQSPSHRQSAQRPVSTPVSLPQQTAGMGLRAETSPPSSDPDVQPAAVAPRNRVGDLQTIESSLDSEKDPQKRRELEELVERLRKEQARVQAYRGVLGYAEDVPLTVDRLERTLRSDPKQALRILAVQLLEQDGSPEAIGALARWLSDRTRQGSDRDPTTTLNAVLALCRNGSAPARDAVTRFLKSGPAETRLAVLGAISQLGNAWLDPTLDDLARTGEPQALSAGGPVTRTAGQDWTTPRSLPLGLLAQGTLKPGLLLPPARVYFDQSRQDHQLPGIWTTVSEAGAARPRPERPRLPATPRRPRRRFPRDATVGPILLAGGRA